MGLVQLLATARSDVNARMRGGGTPLHVACGAGHHQVVAMLAHFRADVGLRDDYRRSSLCIATGRSSLACCRTLLEASADPCQDGEDGRPIIKYAMDNRWDIYQLMCQYVRDNFAIPLSESLTSLYIGKNYKR